MPLSSLEHHAPGQWMERNMADNYVLKINNGRAELYKSTGSYVRLICSDAQSGVVSGNEVHVTKKNGSVEIYTVNGSYIRKI